VLQRHGGKWPALSLTFWATSAAQHVAAGWLGTLCAQHVTCIGAQRAGLACSERPASKRQALSFHDLLVHDQLVFHVQQGVSFVARSIVKACIAQVVLSALRNATALVADELRQVDDQGNLIGAQGEPWNHAEEAEGKEIKIENPEVSTGGHASREGVPVAQPVASERSNH